MTFSVVFTPEADEQILELYRYVAAVGSPEVAARYTEAIVAFCEDLAMFPHRGKARDDIRPGLRTVGFRRRVVVAFAVLDREVMIVGVFYGGRDYVAVLDGSEAASE